jgi:hypothetical protein
MSGFEQRSLLRINQELAILAIFGERNVELVRRYGAIAVVYVRLVPAPEAVAQAIYWLGRTQLDIGDIKGARSSVERMRSTADQGETARTYALPATRVLSGLVAAAARLPGARAHRSL